MNARALYDYGARNEKELSFSQGDILDVVEKTPDGNWWHGFHKGTSGYIPVSYVEITELQAVPTPPTRRSSVQKRPPSEGEASPPTVTSPSHAATSVLQSVEEEGKEEAGMRVEKEKEEEKEEEVKEKEEVKVKEEKLEVKPPVPVEQPPADNKTRVKVEGPTFVPGTAPASGKEKPKKVEVSVAPGSVSKLTQRFLQETQPAPAHTPAPPQKTVLVGPHTHSKRLSAEISSKKEVETPPRSNSGASGLRPSHPAPPPIKPKPPGVMEREAPGPSPFPIMSHDSHVSASPLQKAVLHHQQASSKPTPIKKGGPFKGSYKKSLPTSKPPIPSKPAAPPVPSQALQAELRQQLSHRKHEDVGK